MLAVNHLALIVGWLLPANALMDLGRDAARVIPQEAPYQVLCPNKFEKHCAQVKNNSVGKAMRKLAQIQQVAVPSGRSPAGNLAASFEIKNAHGL